MDPTRWLSRAVGRLSRVPSRVAVRAYARAVGAQMDEAELGIADYPRVADFFRRRLTEGARPPPDGTSLASPADGTYQGAGRFDGDGPPIIVKGQRFAWKAFLEQAPWAIRFQQGAFFSVYLSPKDYHRVHAPCAGRIVERRHVPGTLYPVNALGRRLISDLYVRNERVLILMETAQFGAVVVAFVGATNVGSIRLSFDEELRTNVDDPAPLQRRFDLPVEAGDELGWFELGSTVVVMSERPFEATHPAHSSIRHGAAVGAPPKPSGSDGA
ncbi:MAG: archaetidylserine decarboxylase [Myxococcota bacterium]